MRGLCSTTRVINPEGADVRLLLVHPWAGLPARQELYSELQQATRWELLIITTKKWVDDYGRVVRAARSANLVGQLLALPVGLSGNIPLHFFRSRLKSHIREFHPDCIYIYHEPYAVATFQMLRAAKAISSAPVGIRSSQNVLKRYPMPFRQLEAWVYRHSDFAVVVTDNVAAVMREKGYTKPIHVIPMPVDLAKFRPADERTSGLQLRAGFIGRLVPEKGLASAMAAMARLPPGTLHLTVVGDGPEGAILRDLSSSLGIQGSVDWRGSLDTDGTAQVLQNLDVLLVPSRATASWREQFGRVVIEAAATGIPVIATRSGELPFLVESLGAGWIVEEGDDVEMARVLQMLSDNRDQLLSAGERARRSAVEKYSTEVITGQLIDALSQSAKVTPTSGGGNSRS
jgi:glycosyltransferase involved in cell wall biosynthesis